MIQEIIDKLLAQTAEIKNKYPTVENVRHSVKDLPYDELKKFAQSLGKTLSVDATESRAFIIHSPFIMGAYDSDIWLYSTSVKFKPAEVIEY